MKSFFIFIPVLICAVAAAGCGNKVSLRGKVTYSDDGGPLTSGSVCFISDDFMARGTIQSDGTYRVGSIKETDGIPPGTYGVYISGALREIGTNPKGEAPTESLIDLKHTAPETSGLVLEVTPQTQRFDIVVDRYTPDRN